MTLKEQRADVAARTLALQVLRAVSHDQLVRAATALDDPALPDSPRKRLLTQFVATAAVVLKEAREVNHGA